MKINFIGSGLFKSGGMRVIFEYANRLTENGHEVQYYYPVKPYKIQENPVVTKLKKIYWNLKDYFNRHEILKQLYICKFKIVPVPYIGNMFVSDADIVIATQWPTSYSVNKLSAKKGEKYYLVQGYESWKSNVKLVDGSYSLNLKKITVSNFLRKFFLEKFDTDSIVILNGIDYSIFNYKEKIANKVKTITFIDYILEKKGTDISLNVIKMLRMKYDNIKFLCFGYKKYHEIPEYVEFVENPDDFLISELYRRTDIFLFSSLIEGFGLPPAEAMACKCAVVTTNVGAIPEFSTHMESAMHVSPGNVKEMFDAVCYLLDNENEIQRISENAVHQVRKSLSWENALLEFEKIVLKKYE